MAKEIFESIIETIGDTPMVRLSRIGRDCYAQILAKVESFNPGGSIKDRIGIPMIEKAEKEGKLKPGGTLVEPISGNTGLALAIAACLKGYDVIVTMPDKMSIEKRRILKAYGARVVICPTAVEPDDPRSYYRVADALTEEIPGAFQPNQYHNEANVRAHYETTGPEIWKQTGGRLDFVVIGIGTGGTITGVGRYLKEQDPNIKIVGVDPEGSMFYGRFYGTEEIVHPYAIEGIGKESIPDTLDMDIIDQIIQVNDRESILMARRLVREEAILTGSSSGAAMVAALRLAQERENDDKRIVVIIPDSGERYMSNVYSDEWMMEKGFLGGVTEGSKAEDILKLAKRHKPTLVSLSPGDLVDWAIKLMERHNVSQIPVIENRRCVGSITEIGVMTSLLLDATFRERKIGEVMEPPFPEVGLNEPLTSLVKYFDDYPAVLVSDGEIEDIITKMDIIKGLK